MAKQTGTLSEAFNDAFYLFSHILFLSNIYKELMSTNIGGLESVEFAELVLEAAQWRMECGSGHEATPLIDQVEAIYNKLEISANPRQYGQLYRARVLLARDYGHGQDCLRYAKLEIEQEQVRADREGGLTGELAISNNNMAMAYAYCGNY
ncbi:hypothetical protein UCREL1_1584 [Eutypa lata UCREL1]|uniref:Uncharacterized protein n=1 Tax=Eutypa lata (strain UCR-EL1) TaxID=1287681 RepID=M7TXI9_EUTLA|nr:hypothetical protein UCREL1_1584 [Eutypa lata UCREL1]